MRQRGPVNRNLRVARPLRPRPPTPAHTSRAARPGSALASAAPHGGKAPQPATAAKRPVSAAAKKADSSLITTTFRDFFNRRDIGPEWNVTSPVWHIRRGRLCGAEAKNHGVWLKRRLPVNARIEFDASTASKNGDIKAEFWGDGHSTATGRAYTNATSYLTIFGGWNNHYDVLARLNEHAKNRPQVLIKPGSTELRQQPVMANVIYHFKVVREDGHTVQWFVNDIEILQYTDPKPLKGRGHDHFGFNDWAEPLCFDNLQITPLPGQ